MNSECAPLSDCRQKHLITHPRFIFIIITWPVTSKNVSFNNCIFNLAKTYMYLSELKVNAAQIKNIHLLQ